MRLTWLRLPFLLHRWLVMRGRFLERVRGSNGIAPRGVGHTAPASQPRATHIWRNQSLFVNLFGRRDTSSSLRFPNKRTRLTVSVFIWCSYRFVSVDMCFGWRMVGNGCRCASAQGNPAPTRPAILGSLSVFKAMNRDARADHGRAKRAHVCGTMPKNALYSVHSALGKTIKTSFQLQLKNCAPKWSWRLIPDKLSLKKKK